MGFCAIFHHSSSPPPSPILRRLEPFAFAFLPLVEDKSKGGVTLLDIENRELEVFK